MINQLKENKQTKEIEWKGKKNERKEED